MTGPELRALRLRLGLTQEEMAKRLDVTRPDLSAIENERRQVPKHVKLLAERMEDE